MKENFPHNFTAIFNNSLFSPWGHFVENSMDNTHASLWFFDWCDACSRSLKPSIVDEHLVSALLWDAYPGAITALCECCSIYFVHFSNVLNENSLIFFVVRFASLLWMWPLNYLKTFTLYFFAVQLSFLGNFLWWEGFFFNNVAVSKKKPLLKEKQECINILCKL